MEKRFNKQVYYTAIDGYENYWISTEREVYRRSTMRRLKQIKGSVTLYGNGKRESLSVREMMLKYFGE